MLADLKTRQFEYKNVSFRKYRRKIRDRYNYLIFKRLTDVVVSSFVIIFLLSWLIPVIGMLIKLSSKGPVFFKQNRVGFAGKSFFCLKFRSMRVNEMADLLPATENDNRITRIGSFLRNSNLDELPQFINVFLGDMSLVGPRPHMHEDCRKFSDIVEGYKLRCFVKPGITGLAQVKGFRGPADTFDQVFHRYQYDMFYVRNANFGLDLRIIRQTAAQTFFYIVGKVIGRANLPELARSKKVYRRITFSLKQVFHN